MLQGIRNIKGEGKGKKWQKKIIINKKNKKLNSPIEFSKNKNAMHLNCFLCMYLQSYQLQFWENKCFSKCKTI